MTEPLDFCRVKKFDEKGYGFLRSLYYPGDIFFHFSWIKKELFLDKLQAMKRGDFFLYFQSVLQPNGKRKTQKIWYSLDEVPREFIPAFAEQLIADLNEGKTNTFDIIYAFTQLKRCGYLTQELLHKFLTARKIIALPTTILSALSADEIIYFKTLLNLDELEKSNNKPFWFDDMLEA